MKSRVCMAELGIPYQSHTIDLIETGAYENIRRPFLSVNPGGTGVVDEEWDLDRLLVELGRKLALR